MFLVLQDYFGFPTPPPPQKCYSTFFSALEQCLERISSLCIRSWKPELFVFVKVICIVKEKIMPTRVEKDKADASDIAVH